MRWKGAAFLMLFSLISLVQAQANVTGNCVTGRIDFDPLRTFALGADGKIPNLDVSKYDFTIDYGSTNVKAIDPFGADLALTKGGNFGDGVRISTTRYILYGKLTARMKAAAVGGLVNTFITMSDRKDEIDWEIVGGEATSAQSNIFYKGIKEFGVHGGKHNIPAGGKVDDFHTYTIDWRSDALIFSIDGQVVRTYRNDANAVSPMTPKGERWFPSTPSLVQVSVWDGCKEGNQGTCNWAGGPIKWSGNQYKASFDYIDIQCYDDKNQPVPKWPSAPTNPARANADPSQPTVAAGPLAAGGNPGVTSEYGGASTTKSDASTLSWGWLVALLLSFI